MNAEGLTAGIIVIFISGIIGYIVGRLSRDVTKDKRKERKHDSLL